MPICDRFKTLCEAMVRSSPDLQPHAPKVWFDRAEMDAILSLYGRLVASGEARDYAIDMLPDRAVFAIYRRAAEAPSYRIEKIPALARRQGAYAVFGLSGQVLRRGHELPATLRVFDSRRFQVVK